jgi:hypothetical protein
MTAIKSVLPTSVTWITVDDSKFAQNMKGHLLEMRRPPNHPEWLFSCQNYSRMVITFY